MNYPLKLKFVLWCSMFTLSNANNGSISGFMSIGLANLWHHYLCVAEECEKLLSSKQHVSLIQKLRFHLHLTIIRNLTEFWKKIESHPRICCWWKCFKSPLWWSENVWNVQFVPHWKKVPLLNRRRVPPHQICRRESMISSCYDYITMSSY